MCSDHFFVLMSPLVTWSGHCHVLRPLPCVQVTTVVMCSGHYCVFSHCIVFRSLCSGHYYVLRSLLCVRVTIVCSSYCYVFRSPLCDQALLCFQALLCVQVTTVCSGNCYVFRSATVVCTQIAAQCVSRSLLCVQVMAMHTQNVCCQRV